VIGGHRRGIQARSAGNLLGGVDVLWLMGWVYIKLIVTVAFIDPRTNPDASLTGPIARTTNEPGALTELQRLCRDNRLYEVARWIQAGRPLQAAIGPPLRQRRGSSALAIALKAGNHALALLLLCNGYDPNLEPESPLDLALRARRRGLVDLLLQWGADPRRVSLSDLFDSYNSELFGRFRALGVDLTANHELAAALAYSTSNKPLFGFARRHRLDDPSVQTELNIALTHHAGEGNEKGVMLCLWAGADPHAPSASLRYPGLTESEDDGEEVDGERFLGWTAIEETCRAGHVKILERLGPDPSRDNFDDLYCWAGCGAVVELLARRALPNNVGAIVHRQLSFFGLSFSQWRSLETVRSLFQAGARWETSCPQEVADVRRALLKLSEDGFVDVMKLLTTDEYCSEAILQDLSRTPAIRARMKKVGFIPAPAEEWRDSYQPRPTRSREVLAKFGIVLPKPTPRLPRLVEIGNWRANARAIRLSRAGLFERVWSESVEKLAKEWGLSGRGLAKACRRLQIPVPPRGFWARAQHGQKMRRPRLTNLKPGEAEEILIHAPE
jgi:hypothetical protein